MHAENEPWRNVSSDAPGTFAGDARLRRELHATIAAFQELGPRYEDELIDSYMRRLQPSIDARIRQRLQGRSTPLATRLKRQASSLAVAVGVAALVLSGPLLGIAGAHHAVYVEHHRSVMPQRIINLPARTQPQIGQIREMPFIRPAPPVAPNQPVGPQQPGQ